MAITRTGVLIDTNSSFPSPTQFELNGQQTTVPVNGLILGQTYYAKAYVIDDGVTIYSNNVESFSTRNRDYLTFTNKASGSNTLSLTNSSTAYYNITLDYSTDGGYNWTTWNSANGDLSVVLPVNGTIMFKGDNANLNASMALHSPTPNPYNHVFASTDDIEVSGNIASLVDSTCQLTELSFRGLKFAEIFRDMTHLDTNGLILPFTKLSGSCYAGLFKGCTSLTNAPELPAEYVKQQAYMAMFQGCTSLVSAPNWSCIEAAGSDCCTCMFGDCTSLVDAPDMSNITRIVQTCFAGMFQNCTSLVDAPELPVTDLSMKSGCYENMFQGCTSLVTAPDLPATILGNYCYRYMFDGCTSLENAPELPATALKDESYKCMFKGCVNLNKIVTFADDISATDCTTDWLAGTAQSGTLVNRGSAVYTVDSDSGIPRGWVELT